MAKRNFTYDMWDYDCCGGAFVIAKDECIDKQNVVKYLIDKNEINKNDASKIDISDIYEGVCKYQVRTDWDGCEGEHRGGYLVDDSVTKRKGYFPVWILRVEEWH